MQFPALAFNSTELITCNWGNKAEMDPSRLCAGWRQQKGLSASRAEEYSMSSPARPQAPPGVEWLQELGAEETAQPPRRVPPQTVNLELLRTTSKMAMQLRC